MWVPEEFRGLLLLPKVKMVYIIRLLQNYRWKKSRWSRNSSRISPELFLNFSRILWEFFQDSSRVSPEFFQNFSRILPEFLQNSSRVSSEFFQNSLRIPIGIPVRKAVDFDKFGKGNVFFWTKGVATCPNFLNVSAVNEAVKEISKVESKVTTI